MKIDVWVLSTCIPSECRPCCPEVFATEADAREEFMGAMREEWQYSGPCGDDGERLPFPEGHAPEEINEMIAQEMIGEPWGRWELTRHEIDVPSMI